jgi:OOP family OmpA-OmpF porin
MKKIILFTCVLFAFQAQAQDTLEETAQKADTIKLHNRWTLEAMTGTSDGNYPFGPGFSAGERKNVFSQLRFNSFDLGLRYMITPKFGLKGSFSLNTYKENDASSLPFETTQMNFTFQGVINAARLLEFKSDSRMGLLLHGGMFAASFTSKTKNTMDLSMNLVPNSLYDKTEYHGGFVAGITPQFRISSKMAVFADLSVNYNYRQHMNWNGTATSNSDLIGKATNLSFGLSYSLGKDNVHGDWKIIKTENELKTTALQNELEEKITAIEVMLQDTDRDGVVDYLDVEPNSTGGVSVDTKGRAIDVNKNGIPDELESRNGKKGFENYEKESSVAFDYLMNQNLINLFFDVNNDNPNTASASNLYYIINFLRAYPDSRIRIKGYSDTSGDESKNKELAQKRAQNCADFIIKSGINANRIEILGLGVDSNLDTTTKTGLQLARRVSFELIKQ